MPVQTTTRIHTTIATPVERAAISTLIAEPEAPRSDAPVYAPEAAGVLLALLLLSPKQPKETRDR